MSHDTTVTILFQNLPGQPILDPTIERLILEGEEPAYPGAWNSQSRLPSLRTIQIRYRPYYSVYDVDWFDTPQDRAFVPFETNPGHFNYFHQANLQTVDEFGHSTFRLIRVLKAIVASASAKSAVGPDDVAISQGSLATDTATSEPCRAPIEIAETNATYRPLTCIPGYRYSVSFRRLYRWPWLIPARFRGSTWRELQLAKAILDGAKSADTTWTFRNYLLDIHDDSAAKPDIHGQNGVEMYDNDMEAEWNRIFNGWCEDDFCGTQSDDYVEIHETLRRWYDKMDERRLAVWNEEPEAAKAPPIDRAAFVEGVWKLVLELSGGQVDERQVEDMKKRVEWIDKVDGLGDEVSDDEESDDEY